MLEVRNVTKRYGKHTAVDDLSFVVRPGVVTGFLGPNGAGKSTTMRMIVGLTRPDSGDVLVGGRRYDRLAAPLREVGALLTATAVHPRRTAYHHLAVLAATHGIPRRRVDEVLDMVGLQGVARRRPGGFSLGMSQRLGIAAAMLGDPATVLLDEPVNGLDPEGIRWVRQFLRGLAAEGRTVFLSSHLMSEMALTADQLVIVGRGRLIADVSMKDMTGSAHPSIRLRTPEPERLIALLPPGSVTYESTDHRTVLITGHGTEQLARITADNHIPVYELTRVETSLEDAYLAMTEHDVEYASLERSAA
jgi:ABC-2 type transport system ATP-binding protein